MVTSFFTPCSPILSANSPKNDPPEPGEHLYNVPASSGGRAAAVWGEKDERKASLARPQPQQSPRRGGDSGSDLWSGDQLSGSSGVSTGGGGALEAVSVTNMIQPRRVLMQQSRCSFKTCMHCSDVLT